MIDRPKVVTPEKALATVHGGQARFTFSIALGDRAAGSLQGTANVQTVLGAEAAVFDRMLAKLRAAAMVELSVRSPTLDVPSIAVDEDAAEGDAPKKTTPSPLRIARPQKEAGRPVVARRTASAASPSVASPKARVTNSDTSTATSAPRIARPQKEAKRPVVARRPGTAPETVVSPKPSSAARSAAPTATSTPRIARGAAPAAPVTKPVKAAPKEPVKEPDTPKESDAPEEPIETAPTEAVPLPAEVEASTKPEKSAAGATKTKKSSKRKSSSSQKKSKK